jgi:pentapeptide repeat protein
VGPAVRRRPRRRQLVLPARRLAGRSPVGSGLQLTIVTHAPPRLRIVRNAREQQAQFNGSREFAALLIGGADHGSLRFRDDEHRQSMGYADRRREGSCAAPGGALASALQARRPRSLIIDVYAPRNGRPDPHALPSQSDPQDIWVTEGQMDDGARPRRKAKDNPWYRLATFHGEPARANDGRTAQNRAIWNRWIAPRLTDDLRAALLKKGHTAEELTPFSQDESRTIRSQVGFSAETSMEALVDFSDTEFDVPFFAQNFVFPGESDFDGATFSGDTHFGSATFGKYANFANTTFGGDAYFGNTTFSGDAHFRSVTFSGRANFLSTTFSRDANFLSAAFSGDATFGRATSSGYISFGSTRFSHDANFGSVVFSGDTVEFGRATFARYAHFGSATFGGHTYFGSAIFSGNAYFGSATFKGDTYFGSTIFAGDATEFGATFGGKTDFTNAEMKGRTSFTDAKFAAPPQCFNTKLHEGTTWGKQWPDAPRDMQQVVEFIGAYERLKLEMDRLKKHGDELDFFARELQCRRVLLGPLKGLPIAIYGFLSDYGRSYSRPLGLLAIMVILGAVPLRAYFGGGWSISTFTSHGFSGEATGLRNL